MFPLFLLNHMPFIAGRSWAEGAPPYFDEVCPKGVGSREELACVCVCLSPSNTINLRDFCPNFFFVS